MLTLLAIVLTYMMVGCAYLAGYHAARGQIGKKVFRVWLDDIRKIDVDRFWFSMAIYEKMWSAYIDADLHIRFVRWVQSWKIMAKFPKIDIYLEKKLVAYIGLVSGEYDAAKQKRYDSVYHSPLPLPPTFLDE
jgi:hypothetical protein